jgi:archaellum biogenesis ATPase FlaH
MAGYYFRLPQIADLTISQQSALYEAKQIALSGGLGTGKSVVSLWRHITNFENNRKSLLLTFTTTLKEYLKACCSNPNATQQQINQFYKLWNKNIIYQ